MKQISGSVRVPPEVYKRLKALAQFEDRTIGAVIKRLLDKYKEEMK